jgi:hypothetical protein
MALELFLFILLFYFRKGIKANCCFTKKRILVKLLFTKKWKRILCTWTRRAHTVHMN